MSLPTKPQSRAGMPPRRARVMLGASAKVGKTTLLGNWAPQTTLIVDTHHGTDLLDGEHYVSHVSDWPRFVQTVDDIVKGGHPFHTIGIDLIGDVWAFCDLHHGRQRDGLKAPASGMDDYGRSSAKARSAFNAQLGRLLAAPVGVWFLTHLREKTDKEGQLTAYAPDLDKAIYGKINGAVDFVWLAEIVGNRRRVVHTQPTDHFEAGSRVLMPSPLAMDAGEIARAMDRALNPQDYDEKGKRKQPEPETPAEVPASGDGAAPPPDDPTPVRDLERIDHSDLEGRPPKPDEHEGKQLSEADKLWYDGIKARMVALGWKGERTRLEIEAVGGYVPHHVSSWQRVLCSLDGVHRRLFESRLLAAEAEGTPLEGIAE